MQTSLCAYIVIAAMHSTRCTYPVEIRLILSNFCVRPELMFCTIWPSTEPASRDERDVDPIVILHIKISPFAFFGRKHFLFRKASLTKCEICMNVKWRKKRMMIPEISFNRSKVGSLAVWNTEIFNYKIVGSLKSFRCMN